MQEQEKESVWYRFLLFENAEVIKRIGLPPGKPDFKIIPSQNTHLFNLKKNSLNQIFSILSLSHSFLHTRLQIGLVTNIAK